VAFLLIGILKLYSNLSKCLGKEILSLVEEEFLEFKGDIVFSIDVEHETVEDRDFLDIKVICDLSYDDDSFIYLSYNTDGKDKISGEWNGLVDDYLGGNLSVCDDEGMYVDQRFNTPLSETPKLWYKGSRDRIIKMLAYRNVYNFIQKYNEQDINISFYYGKRDKVKDIKLEIEYNDVKLKVNWNDAVECYTDINVISEANIEINGVQSWLCDNKTTLIGAWQKFNELIGG